MRDGSEQQSVAENCCEARIQLERKFKILDQVMSSLLNSFTYFSLKGWCLNCLYKTTWGVFNAAIAALAVYLTPAWLWSTEGLMH